LSFETIGSEKGDWVIDENNPGQPGQHTGRLHKAGPDIIVQLAYRGGRISTRPLACFEPMGDNAMGSIEERLGQVHF